MADTIKLLLIVVALVAAAAAGVVAVVVAQGALQGKMLRISEGAVTPMLPLPGFVHASYWTACLCHSSCLC